MHDAPKHASSIDWKTLFAAGVFFGGLVWAAHIEISKVGDRIGDLDKHLGKVETAVRIVGAKQGGDTKTLVDEALTVAKNASDSGRIEQAQEIVGIADRLIKEQRASKVEATPDFFVRASSKLLPISNNQNPNLKSVAYSTLATLAEYRSSLSPPIFTGLQVDCSNLARTAAYGNDNPAVLAPISHSVVSNCTQQRLDGIAWIDVTFVNSTIVYSGGPVALNNVRFINCTFQVDQTYAGREILRYAALEESKYSYSANPPS